MSNEHISDYLKYYISLENKPKFAVLIYGEWGSGKTWFIEDFIENSGKDNFVYVSLNGVSRVSQINQIFLQSAYPILSSKGAKVLGKVLTGLLKTTLHIDLNNDGSSDAEVQLPTLEIEGSKSDIDNKTVVFDDFERCQIPLEEMIGYINEFVEHLGSKVVILSNQTKIQENEKYLNIKEKIIGQEFKYNLDFNSAIWHFISELTNERTKEVLYENQVLIEKVFINAEHNNLRHIRQSVLGFDRLYSLTEEQSRNNTPFIAHLIELYFVLSIEIKSGELKLSDVKELYENSLNYKLGLTKESHLNHVCNKHNILKGDSLIGADLWIDFFKYGQISSSEFNTAIGNSHFFRSAYQPNWKSLYHFWYLEDNDFESLSKTVVKELKKGIIDNVYGILHSVAILLELIDVNLLNLQKDDVLKFGRLHVDKLRKELKLRISGTDRLDAEQYQGLGYYGLRTSEFSDFFKYTSDQYEEARFDNIKNEAEVLLNELSASIDIFRSKFVYSSIGKTPLYNNVPIFSYIDPESFVDSMWSLENHQLIVFASIIKERYSGIVDRYKSEVDFFKSIEHIITARLRKEMKASPRKLSSSIIEKDVLAKIKVLIDKLLES